MVVFTCNNDELKHLDRRSSGEQLARQGLPQDKEATAPKIVVVPITPPENCTCELASYVLAQLVRVIHWPDSSAEAAAAAS